MGRVRICLQPALWSNYKTYEIIRGMGRIKDSADNECHADNGHRCHRQCQPRNNAECPSNQGAEKFGRRNVRILFAVPVIVFPELHGEACGGSTDQPW